MHAPLLSNRHTLVIAVTTCRVIQPGDITDRTTLVEVYAVFFSGFSTVSCYRDRLGRLFYLENINLVLS